MQEVWGLSRDGPAPGEKKKSFMQTSAPGCDYVAISGSCSYFGELELFRAAEAISGSWSRYILRVLLDFLSSLWASCLSFCSRIRFFPPLVCGTVLNLRTTTSQKCAAVPRRARI